MGTLNNVDVFEAWAETVYPKFAKTQTLPGLFAVTIIFLYVWLMVFIGFRESGDSLARTSAVRSFYVVPQVQAVSDSEATVFDSSSAVANPVDTRNTDSPVEQATIDKNTNRLIDSSIREQSDGSSKKTRQRPLDLSFHIGESPSTISCNRGPCASQSSSSSREFTERQSDRDPRKNEAANVSPWETLEFNQFGDQSVILSEKCRLVRMDTGYKGDNQSDYSPEYIFCRRDRLSESVAKKLEEHLREVRPSLFD